VVGHSKPGRYYTAARQMLKAKCRIFPVACLPAAPDCYDSAEFSIAMRNNN
jgi:hypothetical protein